MLTAVDFGYCGDHLDDYRIMYLQGKNGQLVNMDVDCDGAQGGGDGSCDSSQDTQGQTTFEDTVRGYNKGIDNLNAYIHSYVVLGNDGSKSGYITFKPESYGVEPLSLVAVVCGDKMVRSVTYTVITLCAFYWRLKRVIGANCVSSTVSGATPTATTALRWWAKCPTRSAARATATPSTATRPTTQTTCCTLPLPAPTPCLVPTAPSGTPAASTSLSRRLRDWAISSSGVLAATAAAAAAILLPLLPRRATARGKDIALVQAVPRAMIARMTWFARAENARMHEYGGPRVQRFDSVLVAQDKNRTAIQNMELVNVTKCTPYNGQWHVVFAGTRQTPDRRQRGIRACKWG